MQIVTGRRGEPHVTSRQMQAVYRSFLGDFALLDIGEKLRAEAYSDDIVRVYDGVVSVQGIYAVIAYNQYDEVYIEPVSVGKKRIDTIVLHYTKDNTFDVEDMQLDVVQGEEYTDNPIAPVVPEGGDAWEGTTDIQVPIYDVEVTNFGLTVTPYARMLTVIPTLDSIAERIPETVVTGVKGDSEVLYRDGDVNITKANIGLGNVDNTADADKPISTATQTALNLKADLVYVNAVVASAYHAGGNLTVAELTSALLIADNMGKVYNMSDSGVTTSDFVEGAGEPINEGDNVGICNVGTEESPVYKFDLLSGFVDLSAYATTSAVNTGLAGKVDKVAGKGLSTEDYTTTDKTKLAGISEGATQTIANPADTAAETLSKLEVEGVVYDIPQGASGATELSELTDVNLSDVEDGDILQYDEPANKWKNSNALQGSKTTTGNPITITDAAPVNAVNLSMDLEPIQDLHGYDHPWVGGAGKNLYIGSPSFDGYTKLNLWTKDSSTYNGHDIYYKTGTWNGMYKLIDLPIGTYTFSAMVKASTASNVFCFNVSSGETTATVSPQSTNTPVQANTWTKIGLTFEVTSAGTVALRVETGTSGVTIYVSEYQLESGSQATSYASYSNICSISGRSEVAITDNGINQWDEEWELGSIDGTTGEPVSNSNIIRSKNFNCCDGGKTYYCKAFSGATIHVYYYDAFKNYISKQDRFENNTVTTPSNTAYFKIIIFGSTYNNNVSVNYPSTDHDYHAYAGKTYTIQIGQDVYGAHHDVTRGKMVVDRAYAEFDGSSDEGWQAASSRNAYNMYCPFPNVSDMNISKTQTDGISNRYIVTTGNNTWNETQGLGIDNTSGYVRIYDSNFNTSDVNTWNTYLSNNPLQLIYYLATPITIPLTPQQIELLENTNTIYTDYESGTMTLEYQPNNAIGEAVRIAEAIIEPGRPILKCKRFEARCYNTTALIDCTDSAWDSSKLIVPICMQMTNQTQIQSYDMYFYGLRYVINNPSTDTWKVQAYIQHRTESSFNEWIEIALWYYELEV